MKSVAVRFIRRPYSLLAAVLALSSMAIGQATPPPSTDESAPRGKILFNRNQDSPEPEKAKTAPDHTGLTVTDAERSALTFTAYDLDVHLSPAESQLEVHARFTVQNSGHQALKQLPLQISSSLHWGSLAMRTATRAYTLPFIEQLIDTDTDHTGKATEAVVSLPQALEPGATIELTSLYSGEITQSAERLERIGAPHDKAARADWDQISPDWTALRGFGEVLWYPTASAPVFLGDGAKLFQLVGQTKRQQAGATFHLRVTV